MEFHKVTKEIEEKVCNDRMEGIAESAQALKKKLEEIAELARG